MRQLLLILTFLWASLGYADGHNQLIVDFKDNVTQAQIQETARIFNLELKPNSIYSQSNKITLSNTLTDNDVHFLIKNLQNSPLIENVEPVQIYSIPDTDLNIKDLSIKEQDHMSTPNDPKFKYQWHMNTIHILEAWKINTGKGAIVAVIDTGVAYENYTDPVTGEIFKQVEDLNKTCFVPGYDFVNDDEHANDDHAHGTHVAGTIAQSTNNKIGVTGIAYQACIMPVKVLSGQGGGTTADVAEGIRWAADHGAHVINMSLGGPSPSGIIKDAVVYARQKGVTIIAAAGNDGTGRVGYPAAYDGVVAVSATDINDKITFYSQYGDDIDIAAPGGDTRVDHNKDGVPDGVVQNTIKTQNPEAEGYFPFMGTSMATPHVAGVAAQIVSLGIKKPAEVEQILFSTADRKPAYDNGAPKDSKWDNKYGFGRLDSLSACTKAKKAKDFQSFMAWLPTLFTPNIVDNSVANTAIAEDVTVQYVSPNTYIVGILSLILLALAAQTLNKKKNLRFNKSRWYLVSSVLGALLGSAGLMILATPFPAFLGYSVFPAVLLIGILGSTVFYGFAAGFNFGVLANLFFCVAADINIFLPFDIARDLWLLLSASTVAFLGYFTLARK